MFSFHHSLSTLYKNICTIGECSTSKKQARENTELMSVTLSYIIVIMSVSV